MLDTQAIKPCDDEFITNLRISMRQLNPISTSAHCRDKYYIHPKLKSFSHAFLRIDRVQSPLSQSDSCPHKVFSRSDLTFNIDMNGRKNTVSIDRVKPEYLLS